MTIEKILEEKLNQMEVEVMDWFYETVKINFGVDMMQDSSDLQDIVKRNFIEIYNNALDEAVKAKPKDKEITAIESDHTASYRGGFSDGISGYQKRIEALKIKE